MPLSQSVFYKISLHCIFRTVSHFVAFRVYFILLRVCCLFLFLSFFLFLLWSLLPAEAFRKVFQCLLQISIVVPNFLSSVSRSGLIQPLVINIANWLVLLQLLVINITGLVQFEKNLSYILSSLASKNYFLQSP